MAEAYAHTKRFLVWCQNNRRLSDREIYSWRTTDDVNCRCDESGMDNSPRFDARDPLYAIDFSCFMANEVRCMKEMALDYNTIKHEQNKVWSVSSFLPLFAGICSDSQAKHLVNHLQDSESFAAPFPIPSISKKDSTYGSDMWRGPVWINYNYMIIQGLAEYGFREFADELITKTIDIVDQWYQQTGTLYEFYDSNNAKRPGVLNRKGLSFEPYNIEVRMQSIRDYGWSCTLVCDLLNQSK